MYTNQLGAAAAGFLALVAGAFGSVSSGIQSLIGISDPSTIRVEVLFAGDMMFDRTVRQAMDTHGGDFVFTCMDPVLSEADLVVANLEGPVTSSPSRSLGSKVGSPDNFVFTFPTYVAALLAEHNVKLVALGNNHILNFGTGGVRSTARYLEEAGVGHFGDPLRERVHEPTLEVPLVFIGYNEFYARGSASTTLFQIREARAAGKIPVVFAHWGDEYVEANDFQKARAHAFIDAGAELVIGGHPHVIQEHEVYKGKHIYYSLGNFIFDQYWNESVRRGMIVHATFGVHGLESVRESYVRLERDRRTCPTT